MLLELLIYEITTTAASLIGVKVVGNVTTANKYMYGINRPKSLPIVDKLLKSKVGKVSKREQWVARNVTNLMNKVSKYKALDYLLILMLRNAQKGTKRNAKAIRAV